MTKEQASGILSRGLALVDHVAEARQGLTAEQLAQVCAMHRSSVYRYIAPLLERGYLVRTREGRFGLGPKVLDLAALALARLDVRNVAHSSLIQLSEKTDATVHLARLDDTEIVYLDKVETRRSLPLVSRVGGRRPAYCTGLGKALLAFLPQARLEALLPRIELIPFTKRTIRSPEQLSAELALIRARGYAIDNEEHEEGIACVAFPIFDLYGEPLAAVSATVLAREMSEILEGLIAEAGQVAAFVSRSFGYGTTATDKAVRR